MKNKIAKILSSEDVAVTVSEEEMVKEIVGEMLGCDGFAFIPMSFEELKEGQFAVRSSMTLHSANELEENSSELEALYLSALGTMISSCFSRLNPVAVIDFMTASLREHVERKEVSLH